MVWPNPPPQEAAGLPCNAAVGLISRCARDADPRVAAHPGHIRLLGGGERLSRIYTDRGGRVESIHAAAVIVQRSTLHALAGRLGGMRAREGPPP